MPLPRPTARPAARPSTRLPRRSSLTLAAGALFTATLTGLAVLPVGAQAQADGSVLNLYSARHYQTDEALYANFTKTTSIKINRLDGKEDELVERIRNEGTASPAELMADIADGIYVTELIGHGVNPVTGDYSRGASGQRIVNGELAGPVAEFTVAGNLIAMFAALQAANDLEWHRSVNVPTIRIDGMMIAGD